MGIESYDATNRREPPARVLGAGLRKEREALVAALPPDEQVSGRFYASNVCDADGVTRYPQAVILTGNNSLWIVSSTGTFRPKVRVDRIPLKNLQNRVGTHPTEPVMKFYEDNGSEYMVTFHEAESCAAFVNELRQHLLMWSLRT